MPKNSRGKTVSGLKLLGLAAVLVFLVAAGIYGYSNKQDQRSKPAPSEECKSNPPLETLTINTHEGEVIAERARTGEQKALGLSCRENLAENTAMLFEYELSGDYCFWMKDMRFPLDMVWLDDEKKVVTIKDNISPETYPEDFCPVKPAKYVIEVNAGDAEKYGWQTDAQLSF